MKRLFSLLLLIGCTDHTSYLSSQSIDWCFFEYQDFSSFYSYIENHKKYADGGNINSMKMLGCAYYQKSDLFQAVDLLIKAHNAGEAGAASALTAIYLKEGDLNKAVQWSEQISADTDYVRWLKVLIEYEKYRQHENMHFLTSTRDTLKRKMNYEGETKETVELLRDIDKLIMKAQECASSECSYVEFNEKRNYLNIFFKGAISTLVPSMPLDWKYDREEAAQLAAVVEEAEAEGLNKSQD